MVYLRNVFPDAAVQDIDIRTRIATRGFWYTYDFLGSRKPSFEWPATPEIWGFPKAIARY
jgi:hypothetical protein